MAEDMASARGKYLDMQQRNERAKKAERAGHAMLLQLLSHQLESQNRHIDSGPNGQSLNETRPLASIEKARSSAILGQSLGQDLQGGRRYDVFQAEPG
ncbi:hypothetical protein ACJ72_06284 [Emergomyces africanus]|uniref:Uncharacterized protein n=1 Tax=Emergomyces africanus TaxID=1955775 RepID=A0A1B7NRP3_9EURO|nr:hypothetical protein ACJ72_06284 [Emergomyces africanus]